MAHLRALRSRHYIPSKNSYNSSKISSIFHRPISLSAQFEAESINSDDNNEINTKPKKPLHLLFKEAVGLSEKTHHADTENDAGTNELKKRLRKLEDEVRKLRERKLEDSGVRKLKENSSERGNAENSKKKSGNGDGFSKGEPNFKTLHSLFVNKEGDGEKSDEGMEDPVVYKELSTEMVLFVNHLYQEGYFKNANFLPRNQFDATCFENSYGRDFVKFAAEKFGKDNQEIAKWLSASDLKKVALFGCPSLGRKNIFSAKKLRLFFGIQEDTVCSKCVLKPSCKFVNQSVWKGDNKNLYLAVVMRVITLYALETVPPQLVVPDEIKESVSRLLKEVVNLSQTLA